MQHKEREEEEKEAIEAIKKEKRKKKNLLKNLLKNRTNHLLVWRLAGVVRAINAVRNVRGRAPDAIRFPPGGMTYRGGGFNDTHKSFFQVGRKYRVPGFLATSFSATAMTPTHSMARPLKFF